MACVVRYTFLLIGIGLRSTSCDGPKLQVTSVIETVGKNINIQCATDKTPQDGVYMYKTGANGTKEQIFYYYKDNTFTLKTTIYQVSIEGKFPNLHATFSNVNISDVGLYWCEFNHEDKVTIGKATLLFLEKEMMKNSDDKPLTNLEVIGIEKEDKKCQEEPYVKIVLIVCAFLSLLCIIGFTFVILKVKRNGVNKKYSPSKQPSDSVYEEMKRSNVDVPPRVRIFFNPEYQSTKLLC